MNLFSQSYKDSKKSYQNSAEKKGFDTKKENVKTEGSIQRNEYGSPNISLDKMNVLYIGVDNPITISSPLGWEKTTVYMTNGTISGNGSLRTVRVNSIGRATITVSADGRPTTFEYRVKKIPDPVFKIGSGKARMPSVEFKSQQFCRVELENFDYDIRYKFNSATVYFSGQGFSNVATASIQSDSFAGLATYIARCGPGTSITFDNVKVEGPEGFRTIEGKSIVLY